MPRLYVYKIVHDTNAAPCVEGDLLTLAICKPTIRSTAQVGDLIFGFAASGLRSDNRLVYLARVTGVEVGGDYYEQERYEGRPDRIYTRGDDGRFRIRPDALFHECGTLLERDVGAFPEYEQARVLVSDDFRYLGSSDGPPLVDLAAYPAIRRMVQGLGQGHRVNHPPDVADELRRLQRSLWSTHPEPILGTPAGSSACGPPKRRSGPRVRQAHPMAARRSTGEPITAGGIAALEAELEELEGPRRRELAARIKAARELGDLKENAEYHIAKDEQAHLETKIWRLQERLREAVVIEAPDDVDAFAVGRTAEVIDEASGTMHRWTLVGSTEADLATGRLSVESPVGSALRDRPVGATVAIRAPRGERRLRIERFVD